MSPFPMQIVYSYGRQQRLPVKKEDKKMEKDVIWADQLSQVAGGTGAEHYTECPACGSKNIKLMKSEGDSKLGYAKYYCPDCGYSETHAYGEF